MNDINLNKEIEWKCIELYRDYDNKIENLWNKMFFIEDYIMNKKWMEKGTDQDKI